MGLAPTGSRVTGSVRLDGTELLSLNSAAWQPLRGRRMGWMTQGVATALEPTERIASQMTAVLRHLRGWETEQSLALAFSVNDARELLSRRWGELSGGQQRLVLASLWLSVAPDLLFADEPSAGLDADRSAGLAAAIREACATSGLTVLVVSHNWTFARAVADRCLLLREGMVEEIVPDTASDLPPPYEHGFPAGGEPILRVRGLSKRYRQGNSQIMALRDLSFEVRSRQTLVLWGRSGSGKTTAARCVVRLLEPDSGQIEFRGIDLRALNTRELRILRRRIQLVEQDAASTIDPKWQVRTIVTEGLRLHEGYHRVDKSQIRCWLELLGLSLVILDRRGGELSIGEAQRVAIARALLLDPELLVLDEPSANLDRVARERLIDSVRAYHARTGGGVLLISHDPGLVQALANEVIVLE